MRAGIEQHLVLHHRSAEARVVGHAVDRSIGPFHHPILDGLQLLRDAVGTFQHIAIHQAAGAEQRREGRDYSGRESGLREPLKDDLPRKVVVGAFFEGEDDIGQTIERDGTHHHHVGNAVHLEFKRKRDQPFDFFGGMVGPLRDDFDLRRREVGIGVHGHALKGQDAADRDESGQHQHQEPLPQRRLDDSVDHSDGGGHYHCQSSWSTLKQRSG